MKQLIILDNKGNNYKVDNPKQFRKHLIDFHTSNGKAKYLILENKMLIFLVGRQL